MQIKCPKCGKETVYAQTNKHRPFCSERCQILDLGAWASESYKVPVNENDLDDDSIKNTIDDAGEGSGNIPN